MGCKMKCIMKWEILRKLKCFWCLISKAHSSKRTRKSKKGKKELMMQSLSQSRKIYQQKMAAKKAVREQNKKKPVRTPKCSYCKEDGHWRVDRSTGHVACPKLVKKAHWSAKKNSEKRERKTAWHCDRVEEVEKETGEKGWKVSGDKDNTKMAVEKIKPVLKLAKNRFSLPEDDSDEEDEERVAAAKRQAAERERVEIRRKRIEAARLAAEQDVPKAVSAAEPQGAWAAAVAAPAKVELVRAERKSWTPTSSDSSEGETGPKLVKMYVPKRWGDDEEDNSAW